MVTGDLRPDRPVELVVRVTEQDQRLAGLVAQPGGQAPGDVVDHAEHADHRGGQDGRRAGLVVEADVPAGDRNTQGRTTIRQTAHGLGELPHDAGVLRRAEVEAVRHRDRGGAGDGDVAVGLGQRELRSAVGVEFGVAPRGVGRHRDATTGGLVDAQHPAVGMLGEHGVAPHIAVVLLGDERPAAQVRTAKQRKQSRAQFVAGHRTRKLGGGVGVQLVLPVGPGHRTLVDRALVGDRARRDVDDGLAVPGDLQPVALDDLADHRRDDLPLAAHGHELLDVLRRHHRAHAFLGLAGEHLRRRHVRRAQRHPVQLDGHAAVTGRCQFRSRTGQSGPTEILDADHQTGGVQLQAALDEHLLHERVADLDARQLLAAGTIRWSSSACGFVSGALVAAEGVAGQHRHPADPVQPGAGTEQDDLVAGAGGERQVQVLLAQHPHAQRVDQRVAGVGGVEHRFPTDVGQTQGVAVAADAAHHPVQDTAGVGGVGRAEAQLVHHRHRASAHGHDVAHDATHARGRTLIGLHVGRVIVRLDLEGHRPAVADVDHAGVLTDAGEHRGLHLVGGGLTEVAQMHLRRLVRAVLAPHHRVHRELGVGGPTAEDVADPLVLVVFETELPERLRVVRRCRCPLDGVDNCSGPRRHRHSLVTTPQESAPTRLGG